jgi:hypothetical protein
VNKRVEALSAGGRTFPAGMLERCFHLLTPRGPALLTRMAERLAEQETSQPDLREHLGSVRKRLPLMQSPTFRRAGWPIGSGMVESANTLVGEARLKGTGMRWERTNVKPMLALRNGVCHERWQETWQAARNQRRDLLTQRRHPRSAPRQEAEAEALTHVPVEPPLPMSPPAPLLPPDPPPMLPGTSRPSAHHPWKRGPSCAPSQCAQR